MKWRESLKLLALAAAILVTDFVSKGLINFYMSPAVHTSSFFPFGGVVVFQDFLGIDFCIHHVTNRGAAWGIGEAFQNGLVFIRAAIILGLFIYMRFSAKAYTYRYPLTMIAAGGIGNILDYFIYDHVVDMFHFIFWGYSYPVFNIADASIFLGIVWLLCFSFIHRKKNVVSQN